MQDYVFYGPEFIAKSTLSNEQILSLTSEDLLGAIKDLFTKKHEVLYYGPSEEVAARKMVMDHHKIADNPEPLVKERPIHRQVSGNEVLLVPYDANQFYYVQYAVGNAAAFGSVSSIVQIFQIALMLLVAPFVMKKIGKRWTALIGMAASLAGYVLTALAGTSIPFLMCANAVKGAGFGLGAATMWGLLQDAITYGQWKTNVQAIGMGNAASSFTMKIGSGIGTAALGWILAAGNFDADPTSASAITSLAWSYIWVPVIACAIGCVCLFLFDLDKKYDTIAKDLEEGKWKGTSEHAEL